ncbi:polysaccharide biosynthesis protein [Lactiplantibacillus modestisalitolerans]|uniref:Polysaccharide biosynthesis protein n=1 Tax=Lactiplantibacillus modestisalitolerans TaxID=1457219 RepID=A0ABV5WW47_9LACO|nr:polysaccharide biosynthesis protein [Lactiplantibacillus modestisalitolerans]
MKYTPKQRLRLAWRWLPLELLVLVACIAAGWGISQVGAKPIYHAQVELAIQQRVKSGTNKNQRQRKHRQDVRNVKQFMVMPHQSAVLYAASTYAYTHYGTWQGVQDLSESVVADTVAHQPILRVTVASSSARIARQNAQAFNVSIKQELRRTLKHYRVKTVQTTVQPAANAMRMPVLKLSVMVGGLLAVLTPYLVEMGRRKEREPH